MKHKEPKTAKSMTPRQAEVLAIIEGFESPPTIREIASALKIVSANGVIGHLKGLENRGYIERDGGSSRSIRVIQPWWKIHACVTSLVSWMADEELIIGAKEAVTVLQQPLSFSKDWDAFNERCPDEIQSLRSRHRWRSR
ncbi:MarR family transcriptional regulator [Planctomicrobium sp. SH668]|uniref:LexA family protein n=1 Tax=Planctomicrobium sp. SH668 TaxID=3448126 RepID=UPI003F5C52AE